MNTQPSVLYTAAGPVTIELTVTNNNTSTPQSAYIAANNIVYLNNLLVPTGFCVHSIPLTAGQVIIGYGATDIQVTANVPLPAPVTIASLTGPILTAANTAVGVPVASLTQVQRNALMVILLYKAGGLDLNTLAVRPLSEWAL